MFIRVSIPGLADHHTTLEAFAAKHGVGADELLDIAEHLNNGLEWSGLYSNTHCSLVRIDAPPRETGTNEGVMNNAV